MDTFVRRVVTGIDGSTALLSADGQPPNTIVLPSGLAVSELLWLDGPPRRPQDGPDREDAAGFPLEPPVGGLSSRLLRMPPQDDWLRVPGDDSDLPGMHATDTLDLMFVVQGQILLGLPGGETLVGPGDAVVQRGTPHRWRVVGDEPCTYWVTMLRPDRTRPGVELERTTGASGRRRLVTGEDGLTDGEAPVGLRVGGTTIVDLWQTGGPLASPGQGGDGAGSWQLEPLGDGVAFRWLELAPGDHGEAGWHETATIDVDVILAGRVALELPGGVRAELTAGDAVVQRATEHRWVVLGDEPLQMATVMLALA